MVPNTCDSSEGAEFVSASFYLAWLSPSFPSLAIWVALRPIIVTTDAWPRQPIIIPAYLPSCQLVVVFAPKRARMSQEDHQIAALFWWWQIASSNRSCLIGAPASHMGCGRLFLWGLLSELWKEDNAL